MKILVVCTSTNVFGAEIATLMLLRALKRRGHEMLAVTSSWTDGVFGQHLSSSGISEVQMPIGVLSKRLMPQAMWWTFNALIRAPRMWRIWASTHKRFQPDVVILTSPKQGLWLYPWMAQQPTFLVEHGSKAISKANTWMYSQLKRRLSAFVAVSLFMADHLRQLRVPPDMIQVIYNCCGGPPFGTNRKPGGNGRTIGIVGQIAPHKGHDLLLAAAELLKKQGVQFRIVAFGRGHADYVAALKRKLAGTGLESLWNWMSYSSDQDSIYENIDVLVVPSMFDEPFGMVALEASIRGIPVVATRRGGLSEIVQEGVTGFLVESGQADELARKIRSLIENPDIADQMGAAARERVTRQFTEEKMVADFEKLFHDALAKKDVV